VWHDSEAECDVVCADFARDLERSADRYMEWYQEKCDELRDLRSEMLDRIHDLQDQLEMKGD
jgi:hypothetical protein